MWALAARAGSWMAVLQTPRVSVASEPKAEALLLWVCSTCPLFLTTLGPDGEVAEVGGPVSPELLLGVTPVTFLHIHRTKGATWSGPGSWWGRVLSTGTRHQAPGTRQRGDISGRGRVIRSPEQAVWWGLRTAVPPSPRDPGVNHLSLGVCELPPGLIPVLTPLTTGGPAPQNPPVWGLAAVTCSLVLPRPPEGVALWHLDRNPESPRLTCVLCEWSLGFPAGGHSRTAQRQSWGGEGWWAGPPAGPAGLPGSQGLGRTSWAWCGPGLRESRAALWVEASSCPHPSPFSELQSST